MPMVDGVLYLFGYFGLRGREIGTKKDKKHISKFVAHENESESLREAILAADVERLTVARENESESLREAR